MALDEYDPRRGRSGRPWRRAVAQLRARGGACHLCGQPIDMALQWPHIMSFSVDHITPLEYGGHPTAQYNLAPAHLHCNTSKGATVAENGERAGGQSVDW